MKNFGINLVGIPKFLHPWRTLLVSRKSNGQNTLSHNILAIFKNINRKIQKRFSSHNDALVIDLTNDKIARITPNTLDITAIYGNEFIEQKANNIRTKKQFEETTDTLIGDHKIPLLNISNFYGVENGKLKSGDISTFSDETIIVPNRAKNIGKVKEILTVDESDALEVYDKIKEEHKKLELQLADLYGLGYNNKLLNNFFYGLISRRVLNEFVDRLKKIRDAGLVYSDTNDDFVIRLMASRNKLSNARSRLNHKGVSFITEYNDTISSRDADIPTIGKVMFANENGNSMFVNNLGKLENTSTINKILGINPMYPILIDNGRYSHYHTNSPSYKAYTSFDFKRDPNSLYIIGTTK